MPTTSVRRLISLLSRSNGLFDQICRQCSGGNARYASTSASASSSKAARRGKRLRKLSATRRHCSRAAAASGWTNTVRIVAATIWAAVLGTSARALRTKCTRQRCHPAPWSTAAIALLRPWWASLITSFTPLSPRAPRLRRNCSQNAPSSLAPLARLQQAREKPPAPHPRHLQLDRPYPRVPLPLPVAVPLAGPGERPLVPLGSDLLRDCELHQRLRERPYPFFQELRVPGVPLAQQLG